MIIRRKSLNKKQTVSSISLWDGNVKDKITALANTKMC